jgi:hypothetical protein
MFDDMLLVDENSIDKKQINILVKFIQFFIGFFLFFLASIILVNGTCNLYGDNQSVGYLLVQQNLTRGYLYSVHQFNITLNCNNMHISHSISPRICNFSSEDYYFGGMNKPNLYNLLSQFNYSTSSVSYHRFYNFNPFNCTFLLCE